MKEQISTIKKKIRGSRGFTLVEALTAILIMLMASSIVVAGIPAARSAYEKVVIASNAEVLLSTTITALRNELGTAAEIANDKDNSGNANEKTLLYLNRQTGVFSKIYTDTEGEQPAVMLQRYIDPDGKPKSNAPESRQLISKEASTADLYVTYDKVSFDENSGIITFTNLKVIRISTGAVLTARPTVSIRVIS
ncbi:MAG: type II secretion system protein [Lachnospiraceae bacterium]|nr:type II secretion system protein [Lachnospiraceae bacterium]